MSLAERRSAMLYQAYESRRRLLAPVYEMAGVQAAALRTLPPLLGHLPQVGYSRALAETISALELTHRHPGYGIDHVSIGTDTVTVEEEEAISTPFARLLHFEKSGGRTGPPILVVPGLAGHFGSLVRGTVRTLLSDNDVYVADWHNARDVPVEAGRFGLDDYIKHLIDFLEVIGPGAHLMAVCQPCVPALAAAAIMAADDHPARPQGIILMAGPVDGRVNPGPVNAMATRENFDRLAKRMITVVPKPHRGAGRRVYPGFLQAMGFLGMDPRRHIDAFTGLFRSVVARDEAAAEKTVSFYDEYFAVLDITEEFYLDTARRVFQDHDLARGCFTWQGRLVEPARIESALLTIEGGKDEMCPPGQTFAAHELCSGIPAERKRHHLQEGVGHYGVFNGRRFDSEIYPQIVDFVSANLALTV
jgi:poly(3-hydroxybutyrate) depolymerase